MPDDEIQTSHSESADTIPGASDQVAEDIDFLSSEPSDEPEEDIFAKMDKNLGKGKKVTPPAEDSEAETSDETEPEEKKTPDEPEEEYTGIKPRPSFKDIKAAFPDLFKKFPALRESFFREQKFTEMFPTIEDAKEASTKAQVFDHIESSLMSGTSKTLLDGLEEADPRAMKKFVTGFLGEVYGKSKELYYETTRPIVDSMIRNLYSEGQRSGNENLTNSALNLANFLYGTPTIPKAEQQADNSLDQERQELTRREQDFIQRRAAEGRAELEDSTIKYLSSEISKGLDPKVFSDTIRDLISEKVIAETDRIISSDGDHQRLVNSLWRRAQQQGFNRESMLRIRAAYLEKARQVMPGIRNKIRTEFLNSKKRAAEVSDKRVNPQIPNRGNVPRNVGSAAGKSPREIDWNKTSDEDFLNDRVTTRR
jgi:hypothetical protein